MKVLDEFHTSLTMPRTVELHAVQGDAARIVVAVLFAGEEPWNVPEGAVGQIGYTLPDGSSGSYGVLTDGTPACTISGNRVEAVIAPRLCLLSGTVKAVIVLEKDEKQISTFPFALQVAARPGYPDLDGEPDAVSSFAGKLFYGGSDGAPVPLAVGEGLTVEDGTLTAQEETEDALVGYVDTKIEALRADLEYEPITITSISIQPSVAQMGAVIESPALVWEVSREPAAQMAAGQSVDPALRRMVLDMTFTQDAAVGLEVTDERGASDSKTAAIHFYNAVYSTSHWAGEGLPTDDELQQMTWKLQPGRGMTIEAEAEAGERVLYAIPSRYGTPEFWANGFQGGFGLLGTISHANAAGYQEDYSIWVSESDGLKLTITVK